MSSSFSRSGRSRREFLKDSSLLLAAPMLPTGFRLADLDREIKNSQPITEVVLDLNNIHKWDDSNGDTWDPFWADDDNLYAFNCDGRGFGTKQRNLAFNRLAGDSPHSLTGTMINTMDAYGIGSAKGADNATWKACGQECIDSSFYAFVSRNTYGSDSHDPLTRQTARNASLIKSTDKGASWTRSAQENYQNPMWPGSAFGAPFFIHYGKNGGAVRQDNADRYVYAISTNGFWNDGDSYVLGRVERSQLASLDAAQWTYHAGGEGMLDKSWVRDVHQAKPILSRPAKCGQSPACYVPSLGVYVMISWFNTETMKKWFEPNEMQYDFFWAPHPWGPWTYLNSYNDKFLTAGHMYGPSLCARFQQPVAEGVRMSLFHSGCPFPDVPAGLYKAWEIPVLLRTGALRPHTTIPADGTQVSLSGHWLAEENHRRATTEKGASAELAFTGTGIELIAPKDAAMGSVDVLLDGVMRTSVSLQVHDFPALTGISVFGERSLQAGKHTLRVVNKDGGRVSIEGFKVYGV